MSPQIQLRRAAVAAGLLALGAACSQDLGAAGSAPAWSPHPASSTDPALPDPVPLPRDAGGDVALPSTAPIPSPTDGLKNGAETDVDCGGAVLTAPPTPRCAPTRTCLADGDCTTQYCAAGVCALVASSCTGAPGTSSCGLAGDESCCASSAVPGGTYDRFADAAFPATISGFRLDRYEITVGRLRAFFEAKAGDLRAAPPTPGAGAHPKIANSGWRASFDVRLPGSWTEINDRLGAAGCTMGGDNNDGGAATWTAAPGPYESLPITCIDWYTLFAFCAWDGGRLPTDAEWGFAAMGGNERRAYAWSNPADPAPALTWGVDNARVAASLWDPAVQAYKFSVGTPLRLLSPVTNKVDDGPSHIAPPGLKTGYGKWGHADLTGNVLEYLLDRAPIEPGPCNDCAAVDWADPPQDQPGSYPPQWFTPGPTPETANKSPDGERSVRGGSWDPTHVPYTFYYYAYPVPRTYYAAGGRCARD